MGSHGAARPPRLPFKSQQSLINPLPLPKSPHIPCHAIGTKPCIRSVHLTFLGWYASQYLMHQIITNHTREICRLCRQYGVTRLEAFGSAVRNDFNPASSDIDLVANFSRTREPGYANRYLDFVESLESLFGRKVDLLTPGAIRNATFAETIKRESIPIYESKGDQAA